VADEYAGGSGVFVASVLDEISLFTVAVSAFRLHAGKTAKVKNRRKITDLDFRCCIGLSPFFL
jgi:hypothetical protein